VSKTLANVVAAKLPRSDPRAGVFGYDEVAKRKDITDGHEPDDHAGRHGQLSESLDFGRGGHGAGGGAKPLFDKTSGLGTKGLPGGGTLAVMADGFGSSHERGPVDAPRIQTRCVRFTGAESVDVERTAPPIFHRKPKDGTSQQFRRADCLSTLQKCNRHREFFYWSVPYERRRTPSGASESKQEHAICGLFRRCCCLSAVFARGLFAPTLCLLSTCQRRAAPLSTLEGHDHSQFPGGSVNLSAMRGSGRIYLDLASADIRKAPLGRHAVRPATGGGAGKDPGKS